MDLLVLALGSVVFVALCQMIDLVRHRWCGKLTLGKVIQLEETEDSTDGTGPTFTPLIEYRVDGIPRRIQSLISMAPALYRTGQEVPVYYFESSPWDARVVTAREYFKWTLVGGGCGFFLLILLMGGAGSNTPAPDQ